MPAPFPFPVPAPAPEAEEPPRRTPVLCAALAVSLNARAGQSSLHDVDHMRMLAEELLPQRDSLREAILSFATRWEALKRDTYALRLLGEELDRALRAALHPDALPSRPYWGDGDD